jgi:hypothetical protein
VPEAAEIRAAIAAVMQTVPDIGMVHDYERYADSLQDFRTIYITEIGGEALIRGWFIRRVSRREASDYNGRVKVTMSWLIQCYFGLQDAEASEQDLDAVLDALVAAFRADETLGGVVDSTIVGQDAGLQVEEVGPLLFTGKLCHSARCRLSTQHFI